MAATKYLALIAGALLATTATAGGDKDHSMKSADQKFERLDKDEDRAISRTEAQEDDSLSATFASVDADGDGELSRSEYTAQLGSEDRGSESMGEGY